MSSVVVTEIEAASMQAFNVQAGYTDPLTNQLIKQTAQTNADKTMALLERLPLEAPKSLSAEEANTLVRDLAQIARDSSDPNVRAKAMDDMFRVLKMEQDDQADGDDARDAAAKAKAVTLKAQADAKDDGDDDADASRVKPQSSSTVAYAAAIAGNDLVVRATPITNSSPTFPADVLLDVAERSSFSPKERGNALRAADVLMQKAQPMTAQQAARVADLTQESNPGVVRRIAEKVLTAAAGFSLRSSNEPAPHHPEPTAGPSKQKRDELA